MKITEMMSSGIARSSLAVGAGAVVEIAFAGPVPSRPVVLLTALAQEKLARLKPHKKR